MTEIWKPVPSYPEYEASSWGRVRLIPRKAFTPNGSSYMAGGKATYGCWDRFGYKYIKRRHRYKATFRIARLVCEAWWGTPPPGAVTMHLDENSRNNRPENLAWGTQKQNLNFPKVKKYHRKVCEIKFKGKSPPSRLGLP